MKVVHDTTSAASVVNRAPHGSTCRLTVNDTRGNFQVVVNTHDAGLVTGIDYRLLNLPPFVAWSIALGKGAFHVDLRHRTALFVLRRDMLRPRLGDDMIERLSRSNRRSWTWVTSHRSKNSATVAGIGRHSSR